MNTEKGRMSDKSFCNGSAASATRPSARAGEGAGDNAFPAWRAPPHMAGRVGRCGGAESSACCAGGARQRQRQWLSAFSPAGVGAASHRASCERGVRRSGCMQWRLFLLLGVLLAFLAAHLAVAEKTVRVFTIRHRQADDDDDDGGEDSGPKIHVIRAFPRPSLLSSPPPISRSLSRPAMQQGPFKKRIIASLLHPSRPSRVAILKRRLRRSDLSGNPFSTGLSGSPFRSEQSKMSPTTAPSVSSRLKRMVEALRQRRNQSPSPFGMFVAGGGSGKLTGSSDSSSSSDSSDDDNEDSSSEENESTESPSQHTSALVVSHHTISGDGSTPRVVASGHSVVRRYETRNGKLEKTYEGRSTLHPDGTLHVSQSHGPRSGAGSGEGLVTGLRALHNMFRRRMALTPSDSGSSTLGGTGEVSNRPRSVATYDKMLSNLEGELRKNPHLLDKLHMVLHKGPSWRRLLTWKILAVNTGDSSKVDEKKLKETLAIIRSEVARNRIVAAKLGEVFDGKHLAAAEEIEHFIRTWQDSSDS